MALALAAARGGMRLTSLVRRARFYADDLPETLGEAAAARSSKSSA